MSNPCYNRQCSFFDTGVAAANLLGPIDRHELFRLLVLPALEQQREALCALYCEENGRPGIEPVVMAGVTLLQFMENLPDRQAAEMVRMHLGWKHALNLEVGYEGFHPASLVKFRGRLVESEEGRLVFDAILQALEEARLVKRRGTRRLDSTHVLGCVSRMGRLEVVRETIRLFLQSADSLGASAVLPQWDRLIERYVCPAGHMKSQCSSMTNAASGKVDYRFEWGALCDGCALKANCTRALNGRRALVVGEHHDVLQQRRKEMKTDEFAKRMHRRNGIEGTISELVRGGARRTRYRGLVKTALANYFHAAAVNAKRWIRLEAAKRRREDGPEGQKRHRTPMWAVISTLASRMWSPWRANCDVQAFAA